MTLNQFVDTFVLGKMFSPVYKGAAEKMCQDCEPFIGNGSKILDLGCGRGITIMAFRDYFQAEVFGVDIADQRIFDFPFKLIDGKSLPFSDNSFDAVLINYVLHHAVNPSQLLKEAKRVSKGKIIIHEDLEEEGLAKIACWLHKTTYKISTPFQDNPIVFYNEKSLKESFNQVGLKITFQKRATTKFSWLYPRESVLFILEK